MSRPLKVIPAKIEVNAGPLVRAWVVFGLYGVACTAAVWLATGWMLTGIAITLTVIVALSAFLSFWRFSSFPAFCALALSALYLAVPAGEVVSWRSYVLIALVTAAFRLFAILSLVSRKTEIVLSILLQQVRVWAALVASAFVILILLQVGTQGAQTNQTWMYLAAGAVAFVAVISGLSLKDSNRS